MGAPDYPHKLTDPRWQVMRLRVFERDDFACRCCGERTLELHAHHSWYEKGREPWEYPMDSIITYCVRCHDAEHGRSFEGDAGVLHLLRKAGFPLIEDRLALAGAILGDGEPLNETQARELAFIIAVLVMAGPRGETWQTVMRMCGAHEASIPRYNGTAHGKNPQH